MEKKTTLRQLTSEGIKRTGITLTEAIELHYKIENDGQENTGNENMIVDNSQVISK